MTKPMRLFVLLAVLATSVLGAARPVAALVPLPPGPTPHCIFPWFPHLESILFGENLLFPIYNGMVYDELCDGGFGVGAEVSTSHPGTIKLFDGWVSATIDAIPGASFKAFMYQVVPQPQNIPEGWHIFGYGVSIFYDNGQVNPDGYVCWALPEGVYGNFELGVFQYQDETFTRVSSNACGYFQGGGQFFLLIMTNPNPLLNFPLLPPS